MPVLFIGHGSPMNAIEDNEFSLEWQRIGTRIPRPSAILCISAHWETRGTRVTAMATPRTIHDFWGFPAGLHAKEYPAPGSPGLARHVQSLLGTSIVALDTGWGLDHGTWSVSCRMYPGADIPVIQLSLDRGLNGRGHHEIGKKLAPLRDQGVLIVGSGNIVHNLQEMSMQDRGYDWAMEFDALVKRLIVAGDDIPLIEYEQLPRSHLSIPTAEHWLPLLHVLGARDRDDDVRFAAEKVTFGAISMRCIVFGEPSS
ncbi:MAG: 4,5-DOPA dioxygenase extradiol [Candidatus Lokiarchaeota archaeon]|nr:4,5-DOPA dioxygenase extradiol [Candidatus Lokiarchaeota archaeon]